MNKVITVGLCFLAGLWLVVLVASGASEYDAVSARVGSFCETLLVDEPPDVTRLKLYGRHRSDHNGYVVRPNDLGYFLSVRRKILARIGSLEGVNVRSQSTGNDVTTVQVWLYGSGKKSEPVEVDLVEDGKNWNVVDIRLQNE